MDLPQVEADAKGGGHRLGEGESEAVAKMRHQRMHQRIRFDRKAVGDDPYLSEHAVETLRQQECHENEVPETPLLKRALPRSGVSVARKSACRRVRSHAVPSRARNRNARASLAR